MQRYRVKTDKSWGQTMNDLETAFSRWNVSSFNVNYPRGARMTNYSQTEEERRVNLTYVKNGKTVNLSMDLQDRAVDNLRVLYYCIDDMRMQERRGVESVFESAYLQLSSPVLDKDPYDVLGLPRGTALAVCEAQYKELAKQVHPDSGGDQERMKELNDAIAQIRKK